MVFEAIQYVNTLQLRMRHAKSLWFVHNAHAQSNLS